MSKEPAASRPAARMAFDGPRRRRFDGPRGGRPSRRSDPARSGASRARWRPRYCARRLDDDLDAGQLVADHRPVAPVGDDVTSSGRRQLGMPTSRSTVSCRSERSPSRGRKGFGVSGRLRGQRRVPPPPARITAYMGVPCYRAGAAPARGSRWLARGVPSERRRRDAEQDAGDARARGWCCDAGPATNASPRRRSSRRSARRRPTGRASPRARSRPPRPSRGCRPRRPCRRRARSSSRMTWSRPSVPRVRNSSTAPRPG